MTAAVATIARAGLAPHQKKFLRDMRNILRRWPPKPRQARWIEVLIDMHGGRWDG